MIVLQPTTSEQEFNICPRDYDRIYDLSLTITEEATGKTETIVPSAYDNGDDWICLAATFSILKENYTYFVSITSDDELWFRSKAVVLSTNDSKVKTPISKGSDDGLNELPNSNTYTIIE